MNFFAKTKGAVSIFLVIILVPMLTVSSIMVDSSRIKLGKAMAESAADLTLNTALTNYDSLLKEVYGLFAMSQNEEDLTANLEEYFKKSIMASKLSEEAAEGFTDEIMASLKSRFFDDKPDADFSDFMKINFSNFQAEKIENSQLSNPSVLKREIVEFMKYRAPISMGLGFIQSIKSFNNIEKKNDVVDKKTKYYDKQSDVMKKCKDLYDDIKSFLGTNLESGVDVGITNKFIEDLHDKLNSANAKYKEFNETLVKDVYIDPPSLTKPRYEITYRDGDYTVKKDGSETVYSVGTFESVDSLDDSFQNYVDYINDMSQFVNQMYATDLSNLYTVQFVRQYSKYGDLVYNMDLYFWKLMVAKSREAEDGEEADEESDEEADDFDPKETSQYRQYDDIMKKAVGITINVNRAYNSFREDLVGKANTLNSNLNTFGTDLENRSTAIDMAISALEDAMSDADGLINEINELEAKKANWGDALSKCPQGDEFTTNTKAEYDNVSELFNKEEITTLKNRLEQIKIVLDDVYPHIDDYKYGSKKLYDIKSLNNMKQAVSVKTSDAYSGKTIGEPPIVKTDLDGFQEDIFEANYTAGAFNGRGRDNINFREAPPKFFEYLDANFSKAEEDESKKEDFNDATNSVASNASADVQKAVEGNSSTSFEFKKEALNLPSGDAGTLKPGNTNIGQNDDSDSLKNDGSKKALEDNGSFITEMFSGFSDLIRDFSIGMRDNLYVTEYGLKMFSYDTFENEIRYKTESDPEKKDSLSDMKTLNGNPLTEEQKTKAITMTTEPINAEKNSAYGAEVEYIIFGLENANDNVTAAYASIFGIRFVLNSIFAFTDSEIRTTSLSIATPISAATLGVIPVPLIQAVIQISIALAETAYDLLRLREGMPIPIYKNKESWVMKPSSIVTEITDAAVGEAVNLAKKATHSAIDRTANYVQGLLDKTDEELTRLATDEMNNLGASLESAFTAILDDAIGGVVIQASEACRQAVEIANASAEDAISKVEEVKARLETSLNQYVAAETTPELKEVKQIAKDYILNESNYVNDLIREMQNKANNSLEQVQLNLQDLTSTISEAVSDKITTNAENLFNKYKDQAINSVKESVTSGQTALKESIDNAFGKFGNSSSGGLAGIDAGNPASSIFSFKYSDYLKLFLFIGTNVSNGDGVIKRMADVIQVNMAQKLGHPVGEGFLMCKAYTYARISAEIEVKPLLITIPLIAETIKNDQTDTRWYKFEYSGIRGY